MKFVDLRKESLEAREGIENGFLVCKKLRERIGEISFFRLERGERGEDLREGYQCRRRWAVNGRCERWVCIHFFPELAETENDDLDHSR